MLTIELEEKNVCAKRAYIEQYLSERFEIKINNISMTEFLKMTSLESKL
jgi:hypothetical protein